MFCLHRNIVLASFSNHSLPIQCTYHTFLVGHMQFTFDIWKSELWPIVDSQSQLVAITIFTQIVRPSVPKLQNQVTITAGRVCGLAEWIIADSCLVSFVIFRQNCKIFGNGSVDRSPSKFRFESSLFWYL